MPALLPSSYVHTSMKSPVGLLTLVANDKGLVAILWENEPPRRVRINMGTEQKTQAILKEAERQLTEYFAGTRKQFNLPLDFQGTDFQKQVWKALLNIPFGQTVTYGEIAKKIGNPKAVRAVGMANNKNPISIIAACHRVIGSNGKLTGYAGGMKAKAHLLTHEGATFKQEEKKRYDTQYE